MYSCVWVPVHWQWRPLSLEVPCFPKHLLAPSHRGPSDLVHLSEGRRKRVNRYFVAAQREANATKFCTWHSSTAFLSACVCVTWQQDAGGDALQDSAHCLPWTKWACGTADNLLHQQLHRLEEETVKWKKTSHVTCILSYCLSIKHQLRTFETIASHTVQSSLTELWMLSMLCIMFLRRSTKQTNNKTNEREKTSSLSKNRINEATYPAGDLPPGGNPLT